MQQAALVAQALDVRYQVTAAELKKLGLTPARVTDGVGGPFESAGNATFKQLFNSWKKLDQLQDGVIAIPSDKPVRAEVSFSSGFGVRSDPFQHGAALHPGIDLSGSYGTPIYATADGTVLRAGWNSGGYGNLVEIDHGRGITTRYGHMSAILVRPGDRITRGQQVGRMGSTGRSTGNHLHYEVRIDGRAVNPIPFMKSTDYVLAMQRRAGAALDGRGRDRRPERRQVRLPAARASLSRSRERTRHHPDPKRREARRLDRRAPVKGRRSCGLRSMAAAAPASPTSSSWPSKPDGDDVSPRPTA